MPLPLVVIPVATAVATGGGITIGALISAIIASLTGGSFIGVLAKSIADKHKKKSDKHAKSRHMQEKMAEERITEVKTLVEEVPYKLSIVAEKVIGASASSDKAVLSARDLIEYLKKTTATLEKTKPYLKFDKTHLVLTRQDAKELKSEFELIISKLESLFHQLEMKEAELIQLKEEVRVLKISLDAQIAVSKRLEVFADEQTAVIEKVAKENDTLTNENETLLKVIDIKEKYIETRTRQLRFFLGETSVVSTPTESAHTESPSFK